MINCGNWSAAMRDPTGQALGRLSALEVEDIPPLDCGPSPWVELACSPFSVVLSPAPWDVVSYSLSFLVISEVSSKEYDLGACMAFTTCFLLVVI